MDNSLRDRKEGFTLSENNTNQQHQAYIPNYDQAANGSRPHSIHPDKTDKLGRASISIIICAIVALMTGLIGFALGTRMQNLSVTSLDYSELNDVYNALSAKYDGELDRNALIEGAAKGLVSAAGDVYTEYMTTDEYNDLEISMSGELNGVGIEIGMNDDDQLIVISTLDDSPAKEAGILAGDLIKKVDDESTSGWTTSQAASKIRGDRGTTVKITVSRNGEEKTFEIERDKIENPSVKWEIDDGIGYMRISTFGDDTAELAKQAAEEFADADVKGVILDLRSNTGGYVDAAQGVASLWLDKGETITEERSSKGLVATVKATGGNVLKDIPTTVLIDGATASASEIVAGALQDSADATLVGTQSYGKGLVQEIVNLQSGGVLKVTIAKWYTPDGNNINKEGLTPDREVEMTNEEYAAGNDTQRTAAEELLKAD